ncbi:molybdopterin-dependent oxidoreductase [Pedobacter sp. HDW13]|uniref:molybdopterin-dependent oxidoreductase n=1 Tax=unclassified Pedobacter TaxID=2628915 RepID=UPI000F5A7CBB|nr:MULTISPECIES: molybdopterin-dependent oxidoreductase [unclassified Pedobacter]QIL38036.1 molybdopterin-dependent oxidoreductase [Pedobacter sp. HDW13]RQO69007.1 molybdopterin-binding oxidoreductase [Pedobacter sp. KBW01]
MKKADHKKKLKAPLTIEQKIKRRSFISFGTFFALGGAATLGWKWLLDAPEETPGVTAGTRAPLRRALNKTELFFRNLFSNNHLVKTYPKELAATTPRVNSLIGIEDDKDFDINAWKLIVKCTNEKNLNIRLEEIKALPKTEIVYDFKCVEGWDEIQYWAGVKLSDFLTHFKLDGQSHMQYMGLETPNGAYYVGLERESILHPQTLLAYEMNGKSLSIEHGAPLRLIVPVKYGIKNLKRIGQISFSNNRPRDYWAEQGYDYYSGL